MKRLNNKGITTIEVLISFVLIVLITVSIYSTVNSYNEKRVLESYKEEVYTYKNTLTKVIQDDFVKIGLTHASYDKQVGEGSDPNLVTYTVNCDLKDGTKRQLVVKQRLAYSSYHVSGANESDYFMIQYGNPEEGLIDYPIPDLGESKVKYQGTGQANTVKDLSINNVLISVEDDNVLDVHIGLYHPELGTKYAIDVVSPINITFSGQEASSYVTKANIKINTNGGDLVSPHGNVYTQSGDKILKNGSEIIHTLTYGTKLGVEGLVDYNDENGINIKKEGYTVTPGKEWNTAGDGQGKNYSQSDNYSVADFCDILLEDCTVTLYVNWDLMKYNITYNLDGGRISGTNPTFYDIETPTFTLNNPTKEGYTFIGWTGSNGTTPQINVSIPRGSSGDRTYTANWRPNRVNIIFSAKGGSISTSTNSSRYSIDSNDIIHMDGNEVFKTIDHGTSLNSDGLPDCNSSTWLNVVKTGAIAISGEEWKCESGCTTPERKYNQTTTYRASDFCNTTNGDCTVVLGINWGEGLYKITLNNNGGTGGTTAIYEKYNQGWFSSSAGTTSISKITPPTREGYVFEGYNIPISAEEGEIIIDNEGNIQASPARFVQNTTLDASWRAISYPLEYDLDYGTFGSGSQHPGTANFDETFYVTAPSKNIKLSFDTSATGATINYTGSGVTGNNQSVAYEFAGWDITGMDNKTHTIDGTETTATSITKTKATSFKNLRSKFEVTITYEQGDPVVDENGNPILDENGNPEYMEKAVYTPVDPTPTFKANWTSPTIKLPTVTKTGYDCKWVSGTSNWASGANYTPATVGGATSRTFTASCNSTGYSISYTTNGGSYGTYHPTTANYDETVQISNPTKTIIVTGVENGTGATVGPVTSATQIFSGWTSTTLGSNAQANGSAWSGSLISADNFKNLRESGTVTLVANWTPVAITLPTVTKSGATCGWYTASTGGSFVGKSGASWTPLSTTPASVTLYARCVQCSITPSGGTTGSANSVTWYKSGNPTLTLNTDATSYSFCGPKGASCSSSSKTKTVNSDMEAGVYSATVTKDSMTATCSITINRDTTGPKMYLNLMDITNKTESSCNNSLSSDSKFPCIDGLWYTHFSEVGVTNSNFNASESHYYNEAAWQAVAVDVINSSETVNQASVSSGSGFGSGLDTFQWDYDGSGYRAFPTDSNIIDYNFINGKASSYKMTAYKQFTSAGSKNLKFKAVDKLGNISEYTFNVNLAELQGPEINMTTTGPTGSAQIKVGDYGKVVNDTYLSEVTVKATSDGENLAVNCAFSKGQGTGTFNSSKYTDTAITNGHKIKPNLDTTDLYVINVVCTATATKNGITSTKTTSFNIGNGWKATNHTSSLTYEPNYMFDKLELIRDSFGNPRLHDDWQYYKNGDLAIGWQKLYWFDGSSANEEVRKGNYAWYYFYNGSETSSNNRCYGTRSYMAYGWCKNLPDSAGNTSTYAGKWFYFRTSSMRYEEGIWIPNGAMLSDISESINSKADRTGTWETYTFGSNGVCTAGSGC